jgi:hypothetical protein
MVACSIIRQIVPDAVYPARGASDHAIICLRILKIADALRDVVAIVGLVHGLTADAIVTAAPGILRTADWQHVGKRLSDTAPPLNRRIAMRFKVQSMIFAGMVSAFGLAGCVTAQPVPGPHPAYLHALSDLRAARHYLNDGWAWEPVRRDDNAAIREIDAAISEIKRAAIDDGKGVNDPFPIDTGISPRGRFVKAKELLRAAHEDLSHAEDVPSSRGLRDRAIMHVDRAHQIVNQAQATAHWQ